MPECGHFFPFLPFGFFFLFFVIFCLFLFKGRGSWKQNRFDSETLLQRRLINGEIDEKEYERLREIIHR
ncbi:hypothetical protein [Salibacterium aidingense]|uniref:hypothetical protein n=1 Tax=Salibacterium aidingense TaxID=384933 RepID=UPI0012EC230A|nr:hypothetical protein [Salibacterium aidingense]